MKVLVFGKSGQVATELARQADVTSVGRDQADLTDPAACAAIIAATDADIVINAAAYTAVDRAEEDETTAAIVNGAAPGAMARAAAARGMPFLHISTDYVFNGQGDHPWQPDDPTGPLGAYGRTKLLGEQATVAEGGRFAILRTSWVVSAHGNNFVKTMLKLGQTRASLNVVADQFGAPTPAADIAAALLKMAKAFHQGQGRSGIYHFAGRPDTNWADFARSIFRLSGLAVTVNDIPSSAYPTPAERPANSRMDCTLIERHFGIARPDWQAGLKSILSELGDLK